MRSAPKNRRNKEPNVQTRLSFPARPTPYGICVEFYGENVFTLREIMNFVGLEWTVQSRSETRNYLVLSTLLQLFNSRTQYGDGTTDWREEAFS